MDNQTSRTAARPANIPQAEWARRIELAAAYRLVALFKWDDLITTHISARVPGTTDQFLINPYGWYFEEITASSLVKVDLEGRVIDGSTSPVNPAGFVIHSAIHAARHNAECVVHTHAINGTAVSTQRDGLLPITQHAMVVVGNLGYHDYEGIALRDEEKARLVRDLGRNNFLMLRNHGLLTVGGSVAEAWNNMYLFETACTMQVRALAGGKELVHIPQHILATAAEQLREATLDKGPAALMWPGMLRRLDRMMPGYET
jgi:ribulose-5-phosphate 4-epimerase/fuculose-1-phosphate aldolase